jgi:hypothetical protein
MICWIFRFTGDGIRFLVFFAKKTEFNRIEPVRFELDFGSVSQN